MTHLREEQLVARQRPQRRPQVGVEVAPAPRAGGGLDGARRGAALAQRRPGRQGRGEAPDDAGVRALEGGELLAARAEEVGERLRLAII